ncbi:ABC transporter permease [Falsirhodobacter xinxiangensis]|uniref:ABC transporter permease n=1 Tax=Falsirhodobacter xinxiangensis TaxID=2530049 RepID=UPI0010AA0241|nr:ABC transporter permease [Rhodobacter xinxiangensis]
MLIYILKRLGLALIVALTVSVIAFALLRASGDIATALAGEGATPESIAVIRQTYGLDRPIPVQYLSWLWDVARGDFGQSYFFRTDVAGLIFGKIGNTLILGAASLAIALALSIPLGVLAAIYSGSIIDRAVTMFSLMGQALPSFFLALALIMVFAINLRMFPASGADSWRNFVLPALTLGYYITPPFMRLVRAGMIDALNTDYVRTARAKGLPARRVVFKHALRNALVPVVGLVAVQLGLLMGGSVVVESIFALDGLGYLAYQSISYRDFPVLQGVVLLLSLAYVVLTLLSDIINAWLDPRLRAA